VRRSWQAPTHLKARRTCASACASALYLLQLISPDHPIPHAEYMPDISTGGTTYVYSVHILQRGATVLDALAHTETALQHADHVGII
jgi:hypothetical protein